MDDTELQQLLRDQLPALTASAAPPAQYRDQVRLAVARRHRRLRVAVGTGIAGALALVILLPLAVMGGPGSDDSGDPVDSDDGGQWRPIAPSPLSPRNGSASVWTGEEMIVAGGNVAPPCPPGAECVGPAESQLRADGAAYDPSTDTWRPITPAPVTFTDADAAWTEREMVVLELWGTWNGEPGATLAYDPDTDAWRQLDAPPDYDLVGGVWDGHELVFWESEERADSADWALDPATGQWTKLPDDPFEPTYDRAYVWTGDRFIFVGLDRGSDVIDKTFQVAEYDPASRTWRRLPDSPVGFGDPMWFFHQGYVVNPFEDPRSNVGQSTGGRYDPDTRTWSGTPHSGIYTYEGCRLGPLGSAGDWLAPAGGVLYSLDPADTVVAPDCPQLPEPTAGAWTGEQVILWGGPATDYKSNADLGLTWTPPPAGD